MRRDLFTAGYEGINIDTFISNLQANNINCVLDVRALPLSRKPGFSKNKLGNRLKDADIQYVHLGALGSPKDVREKLKSTRDYSTFFRTMDTYLSSKKDDIEVAYSYVTNSTCCLMCFEHLAEQCHRKIVAKKIINRDGNGLKVKHI
jgi:uncharacterized protein (DUF488 family)